MAVRPSLDEIREAIRQLPESERQKLLDEMMEKHVPVTPEDVIAVEVAMDRSDGGEFIRGKDLKAYMEQRRKERQGGRS